MGGSDLSLDMSSLRRLHQLIGRVSGCRTLAETLQTAVDGVVETVGFDVAAVSYRHTDGTFEVVAVAGSQECRDELLGQRLPASEYDEEFALADHWGALRFVPHERLPNGTGQGWVPDLDILEVPDAWHPQDALFAPLCAPTGELVGMLSVDLPHDRRRPGPLQRELLEMFAAQAGIAVDNARLTERLQTSEEAFRLAFERAGTGMAVVDLSPNDPGRYLRVNPALCRIIGYSEQELLARTLSDLALGDDRSAAVEAQSEQQYLHASGATVWVGVTTSVVRDAEGSPLYAITQVEDISVRKAAQDALVHRAQHDPLTGLPNRHVLDDRLSTVVANAAAAERTGAVLFCDLDGFKDVNDRHGHAVGDRVLTVVAQRLAAASRGADTVARLGGDEFVVVAEGVTSGEATDLAERLRRAVGEPIIVQGVPLRVTASIGIAAIGPDGGDPTDLLQTADSAMYRAKLAGRNALAFAEPLGEPVRLSSGSAGRLPA